MRNNNTATASVTVHVAHPTGVAPKTVNLILSKPGGCGADYGPACATPASVTVSAPAFAGNAGTPVEVLLCNAKAFLPRNADGSGGDGDPSAGCDYANGKGLGPAGVPNSGALNLDASGNLAPPSACSSPSTTTLTALGGAAQPQPRCGLSPTPRRSRPA